GRLQQFEQQHAREDLAYVHLRGSDEGGEEEVESQEWRRPQQGGALKTSFGSPTHLRGRRQCTAQRRHQARVDQDGQRTKHQCRKGGDEVCKKGEKRGSTAPRKACLRQVASLNR